jgi:hypothetical protein
MLVDKKAAIALKEPSVLDALSAIVRIDEHALIVVHGETARTHARRLDHPALDPVP